MAPDPESSSEPASSENASRRQGMRLSSRATLAGVLAFVALGVVMTRAPRARETAESAQVPPLRRDVVASGDVALAGDVPSASSNRDRPTQVAMRNVDFHADSSIVLRIHHLRGTMRGRDGRPIVFDDKRSFTFRLAFAEVSLTAEDLAELLNRHVFAFKGAPLRRLAIRMQGEELEQSGQMKKGFWLPFRVRARVAATPDGRIRLHPTRVRVLGIPAEAVMRWFGIHINPEIADAFGLKILIAGVVATAVGFGLARSSSKK